MTVKLKPITTTSWLVLGDTEDIRIGLLSEIRDNYILMVKGEKKSFINRKEVTDYFKENIFENLVEIEKEAPVEKVCFINGYPVDFDNPHEVFIKGNKLPLFSKKITSDVYYSAGYYCLKFNKNWMSAFCPKLSTLETYKYAGPFKDEFSMKQELARLRKLKDEST